MPWSLLLLHRKAVARVATAVDDLITTPGFGLALDACILGSSEILDLQDTQNNSP